MRKGLFVVIVIAVLGVGYLAAQATSSLLFERELERIVNRLDARSDLQVERRGVEQGWFASHGEIVVTPRLDNGWRIELPYTARHGLLSTRADGSLMPILAEEAVPLFGERLPATPPRWHANYRTLSNDMTVRVDLAAFRATEGERQFDFQGGELVLDGRQDDLQVQARVGPLQVEQGESALLVEPLTLETRYRAGTGQRPPRWSLETLRVSSPSLGLSVDIVGELRFTGGDWGEFRLTDLESAAGRKHWRSRLDGHFTWTAPPPLVAMQLGLPLDTERLTIEIEAGEVTVNGRPLPSFP
ncbi:DUF945 family protein [Litchfieldella rifensis]|uniref:DUF945 family protein n=1 Tax=Litchfieldella rifensis TaxID=762643 RepID=A0ABV7LRF7_9GAMM